MRFYGLDLREAYQTESVRRVWALVTGLPAESATWVADAWTHQDEMLASAVELIDGWGRLHWVALGGDPRKVDDAREYGLTVTRPTPPEPDHEVVHTTDTREIMRWFAEHSG